MYFRYISALSLKPDTQSAIIEAFNNTSRYLDDIFNIDNPCFDTANVSATVCGRRNYAVAREWLLAAGILGRTAAEANVSVPFLL